MQADGESAAADESGPVNGPSTRRLPRHSGWASKSAAVRCAGSCWPGVPPQDPARRPSRRRLLVQPARGLVAHLPKGRTRRAVLRRAVRDRASHRPGNSPAQRPGPALDMGKIRTFNPLPATPLCVHRLRNPALRKSRKGSSDALGLTGCGDVVLSHSTESVSQRTESFGHLSRRTESRRSRSQSSMTEKSSSARPIMESTR